MAEEKWHGIPRSEIPRYPTIDYEKCVSFGKCVDYCKLGTFEFEEKEGEKKTIVKNPNKVSSYALAVTKYVLQAQSSTNRRKKLVK